MATHKQAIARVLLKQQAQYRNARMGKARGFPVKTVPVAQPKRIAK